MKGVWIYCKNHHDIEVVKGTSVCWECKKKRDAKHREKYQQNEYDGVKNATKKKYFDIYDQKNIITLAVGLRLKGG